MATVKMKEGWIVQEWTSPHGDRWAFSEREPDYLSAATVFDKDSKVVGRVEAQAKRILYIEADSVELST